MGSNRKDGLRTQSGRLSQKTTVCECGELKSPKAQRCFRCSYQAGRNNKKKYAPSLCACGRRKTRQAVKCRHCDRNRGASLRRPTSCEYCGTAITRKYNTRDARRFCNKRCSGAYRTLLAAGIRALARRCADCGEIRLSDERRYCAICRYKRKYLSKPKRTRKEPTPRTCEGCRLTFIALRARFCKPCLKRRDRRGRGKYRERCRRAGVPYQPGVTPSKVFARDGYRCQLCGRKTPPRLRGTCQPNAPELDHIVPISAACSPGHVWSNVQCACRSCNGKKHTKPLGQLKLAV